MSSLDGAPLICDENEGYAHLSFTSELPREAREKAQMNSLKSISSLSSLSKASKMYPANSLGSPEGKNRLWKSANSFLLRRPSGKSFRNFLCLCGSVDGSGQEGRRMSISDGSGW